MIVVLDASAAVELVLQREHSVQIGMLGTDITTEGPFKKGYAGSYLFNYRYSSLSVLDNMGVVDFGGVLLSTVRDVLPIIAILLGFVIMWLWNWLKG